MTFNGSIKFEGQSWGFELLVICSALGFAKGLRGKEGNMPDVPLDIIICTVVEQLATTKSIFSSNVVNYSWGQPHWITALTRLSAGNTLSSEQQRRGKNSDSTCQCVIYLMSMSIGQMLVCMWQYAQYLDVTEGDCRSCNGLVFQTKKGITVTITHHKVQGTVLSNFRNFRYIYTKL